MKKSLVVYYSKSGNNRYLADKIAERTDSDIEELQPRVDGLFFHLISILTKISTGNRALQHNPSDYEKVILVGPIWVGSVIPPLRNFLKKYRNNIKSLYFVTGCGSTDDAKNDKFGYETIVPKVESLYGKKTDGFIAFPVELVLSDDEKGDDDATMKARFSDENFKGPAMERLDLFTKKLI